MLWFWIVLLSKKKSQTLAYHKHVSTNLHEPSASIYWDRRRFCSNLVWEPLKFKYLIWVFKKLIRFGLNHTLYKRGSVYWRNFNSSLKLLLLIDPNQHHNLIFKLTINRNRSQDYNLVKTTCDQVKPRTKCVILALWQVTCCVKR